MMMQLVEAGNSYATTASGYVLTILTGASVLLMAWVVRTMLRIMLMQQKLMDAMFPANKKSLPDQVDDIRLSVRDIRTNGSNRLNEIMNSARIIQDIVTPDEEPRT